MAEDSTQGDPPVVTKQVWTFEIRGGSPFRLDAQSNPSLLHGYHFTPWRITHNPPSMTLWKMVGTTEQADAVEAAIHEAGAKVRRYTEEQSPEQRNERLRLLGRGE